MKSEPLSKVAPARSSDRHVAADAVVWHLNLDQIVSGSGAIANRVHAHLRDAGTSTFVFDERNVLYSKLRPYLNKVVCPDSIGVATTELVPLRPDPQKLDRNYLCYYLRSPAFVSWVSSQVAGAKMPRVSMKSFWSHEIPLPPLEDQIRIAYLLSKVEGLIAQRKQHLQQLDDLLKSVFLNMFGDPLLNPKNFPIRNLSDFYINPKEGTKCGPFGSALKKTEIRESGIPVWNMDNIGLAGKMITHYRMWISEEKYAELKAYNVQDGDVVISRAGTVGKMCVATTDNKPAIISTNLIRLRLSHDLNPHFFVLLMTYFKGRIGRLKTGPDGSFTHMNTGILDSLEFPYPEVQQQTRFVEVLTAVKSLRMRLEKSQSEYEHLYGVVSQQAFSNMLNLSRINPPESSSNRPSNDTPHPIVEPTEQEPFDLPTPPVPSLEDAYKARALALMEWLKAYSNHPQSHPFSADEFLDLVQQKLSSMEESMDAEWVTEPVGARDYEQVKAWVFDNVHSQQLQQTYDDNKNRVRVSQGKD